MSTPPPRVDAPVAARVRADLEPWTVDAVTARLGERAMAALGREQVIPARTELRHADDPLAVLTRLFMLGEPVARRDLDRALPEVGPDGAASIGLIEVAGAGHDDQVRAAVDLRPYAATMDTGQVDWWVASDLGEAVTQRGLAADHVLGIGGASRTLASWTMRTPRRHVLDLGTGCGIQALHASLHADAVVATDVSRRALAFAGFNEWLNAPTLGQAQGPWDLREGSLLDPAVGEQFDLVVSNPPFVITPEGAPMFEYRAAGLAGDGVMAALVGGVGDVLASGGVAQLLGNWEITGDWSARLEEWLDASRVPLDAWVIQRDMLDAAEYAETWLRDAGLTPDRDPSGYAEAYATYLRAFDGRGIEGVGFGMVLLRRPASGAPTLRRLEEHEGPMASPLGPHVAQVLAAHDWLAAIGDQTLLETALTVAPDVTKETYGRPLLGEPEHILIRQGGGLGRALRADTALAGFVGACDGELTVGQIGHALAALLDVPASAMIGGLVPAVRDLVRDGLLTH